MSDPIRSYYTPPDQIRKLLEQITKPNPAMPAVYAVIGDEMSGKTAAMQYLPEAIKNRLPYVTVKMHDCANHDDIARQLDEQFGQLSKDSKHINIALIDGVDLLPFDQQLFLMNTLQYCHSHYERWVAIFTARGMPLLLEEKKEKEKKRFSFPLELIKLPPFASPDFWNHTLQHIRSLCSPSERNRVERLLDLFAALPSSVEFDVLCDLSGIDPDELRSLLDKLHRWFPERDGEYAIIHPSFRDYFAQQHAYAARLYRSRQQVNAYYRQPFLMQHIPASVPFCILRHLPEMFIGKAEFVPLLLSDHWDWTSVFRQLNRSYRHPLLRALKYLQSLENTISTDVQFIHSTLALIAAAPADYKLPAPEYDEVIREIEVDTVASMSKYLDYQSEQLTQLDLPYLLYALSIIIPTMTEKHIFSSTTNQLAELIQRIVPIYHPDDPDDPDATKDKKDNLAALYEMLKG